MFQENTEQLSVTIKQSNKRKILSDEHITKMKTSVKLSSFLDDTLLSEIPVKTQEIIRELMKK